MNKLSFLLIPLLILSIAVACSEKPTVLESSTSPEISALTGALSASQIEAREHILKKNKEAGIEFDLSLNKTDGELTYISEVCDGVTPGTANVNTFPSPDLWNYYRFSGNAGDIVDITVNRTSDAMDAAYVLYSGIGTTTDGLTTFSGNAELTWVAFSDDVNTSPFGGCFQDPQLLGFVLPSTGDYTLAVFDFIGCGTPPPVFEVVISGIPCAADLMAEKAETIAALTALMTGEKTDKELEKAIEKIEKSLNPEYWIDETHLDSSKGKKVFDEEKKAVNELEKIQKDKNADPLLKDAVTVIIGTLVSIDEQLALTALAEIEGSCVTDKCAKELEKVYKELGKAAEEIAKGHMDHAIDKYKKAWEHTQHAIKHNT